MLLFNKNLCILFAFFLTNSSQIFANPVNNATAIATNTVPNSSDDPNSTLIHRFVLHLATSTTSTTTANPLSLSSSSSSASSSSSFASQPSSGTRATSRVYLEKGNPRENGYLHGGSPAPSSPPTTSTSPNTPIQTSIQVYIIFVIGIVPAAIAGTFWWFQNLCNCFHRANKKQHSSASTSSSPAYSDAKLAPTAPTSPTNSTISSQTLTSHVPSTVSTNKMTSSLLKNAKSLDNLVMARKLIRRAERRISENTDDEPKRARNEQSARSNNHYKTRIQNSGRLGEVELARNSLEMIQILGEGNFGQVWKAKYFSIDPHLKQRSSSIVAVKTLKVNFTAEQQEDLLKELDIMLQLGTHPNVVRLLGCCTENEPYYLVLEYLAHGKLLSFLRKHRKDCDGYYSPNHTHHSGHHTAQQQYTSDGCTDSTSGDLRTLLNPSLNWYSNNTYRRHSTSTDELTPYDLVAFAEQIASGMEFISAHGIIHRDLAARNILVNADRQCKIADFGLSRSIRDSADGDWYEMKHGGQMPIRWMSPEALSMGVFSTKSDVWAYGVLLWEIATLGSTPYVGMGAQEVISYIRQGNICPRPEHCDSEFYELMMSCWAYKADERLTFAEIRAHLRRLLVEMDENELNNNKSYIDLEHFNDSLYYFKTNVGDEKL